MILTREQTRIKHGMSDRTKLPSAVVQQAAYDLLEDYAYGQRITLSEAIRQLIASNPALIEFALSKHVDAQELFEVANWRGKKA